MSVAEYTATTIRYEHDRAVARLVGEVGVESILSLCDRIDLALEYYQYADIVIQLASPGGAVTALEHFLTRLTQWRATPGVHIETVALTHAASAAALILSLGDIGCRSAYASSELLYHSSRMTTGGGTARTSRSTHSSRRRPTGGSPPCAR